MATYRNRTTGEVKSQSSWRAEFAHMSLPRQWKSATLDALDLDLVFQSPTPPTGQYQVARKSGVAQDDNGNWVDNWEVVDMFADTTEDGVTTTKAEHETAYQAKLDANMAENHRVTRNKLLADSDWTQMNDSPLSNEDKTSWATYRQELRDMSDLDAWPNIADDDWPVAP
jgi:hypothetical protein